MVGGSKPGFENQNGCGCGGEREGCAGVKVCGCGGEREGCAGVKVCGCAGVGVLVCWGEGVWVWRWEGGVCWGEGYGERKERCAGVGVGEGVWR